MTKQVCSAVKSQRSLQAILTLVRSLVFVMTAGIALQSFSQVLLTGTVKSPDGSNFTGRLTMEVSQPAAVAAFGSCGGPVLVVPQHPAQFNISNGAFVGTPQVYGNDCMTPINSCYIVDEYDAQNNHLTQFRWTIIGPGPIDVGTLAPNGPQCNQVPTGQTFQGDMTITGNLNVLGNFNATTQTFSSTTVQNITVQGLISGSLAALGPTGTGLKSDGTQYVATVSQLPGSGGCPDHQWINNTPADSAPNCLQPDMSDVTGIAAKAQQFATTVYTDQANTYTTGNLQQFLDSATNFVIANVADPTKQVTVDLSAAKTATTVVEKVPDVTALVPSSTVTRLYKETQRSTLSVFLPGSLSTTWTAMTFTPDGAITVTRADMTMKTAPSGCSSHVSVRMSDGTNNFDVTENNAQVASSTGSTNFAAGVAITVSVRTAASGCSTTPADANVVYQYRMN